MNHITRRRFLLVAGGATLAGCAGTRTAAPPSSSTSPSTTRPSPGGGADLPTPTVVTTTTVPSALVPDDRVLVVVELNGGNDAINTLPPTTTAYHDLRPTLALADDVLVGAGFDGHALHPSLAPMIPLLDAGVLAVVAGIGWDDPDRSHFASMDRWFRADRVNEPYGWIGRWLDTLDTDLGALGAVALGSNNELLTGAQRGGTLITAADAFRLPPGLSNSDLRALTEPISADPSIAAAQRAFAEAIGAVAEFDPIADAVRAVAPSDPDGYGPVDGPFSTGLAVAAELILADADTRVVSVSGSGFDTHADQLDTHADLLGDLAYGLVAFWATLEAAGQADRVLLVTTSEFGRRAVENGSGGCDHGAGGVSFALGRAVVPGLHGAIELNDLLDGDLRPIFDPRSMFTGCLDWLGGDPEKVLGDRYEDFGLLA